jgi:hypothetical protein
MFLPALCARSPSALALAATSSFWSPNVSAHPPSPATLCCLLAFPPQLWPRCSCAGTRLIQRIWVSLKRRMFASLWTPLSATKKPGLALWHAQLLVQRFYCRGQRRFIEARAVERAQEQRHISLLGRGKRQHPLLQVFSMISGVARRAIAITLASPSADSPPA